MRRQPAVLERKVLPHRRGSQDKGRRRYVRAAFSGYRWPDNTYSHYEEVSHARPGRDTQR